MQYTSELRMEPTQGNSARPRESQGIIFDHKLTNAPGKSIIGVQLEYPPNGFTPPHRHGGATVVVVIQDGQVLSGMNGTIPRVYQPGETFVELPGCHHTVAENNSRVEGAKFMAIFVVDTEVLDIHGYDGLTVLD